MAKEYEKILDEIKKGTDSISGATKEVEKINNFIDDSKGDVKQGFKNLMSKLDAINTITSWDANIKKIGTSSISDTVSGISRNVSWIVSYASTINDNVSAMTAYLKTIKEKIEGFSSIYPTGNGVSNASGSTNSLDGIHDTVKKIYTILGEIKSYVGKQAENGSTGDPSLDELIKIRRNLSEKNKLENEIRKKYREEGWTDKSDTDPNTLAAAVEKAELKYKDRKGKHAVTNEKEYLKYLKQKDKEQEKRDRKIKGESPKWLKISGGIAKDVAGTFISTEKPTTKALADKGISAVSQLGNAGAITGVFLSLLKSAIEMGSKRERSASQYARTIGGGMETKYGIGETIRKSVGQMSSLLGATFEEAITALTEYAEARGRTTEHSSKNDIESSIMLKRMGISADAVSNFDSFGKSLRQTDEYFTKLYGDVSKKGLSFKNVSKAVNDNLKMAQSHTFANGLRGLEKMAEKSVQLKYNMQQVFQFAEKVSDVEEAIKTSANLSVLGGSFAQFSNPMQLLYEGLNDTEAMNNRILGMFGGKAYWDKDKGEINMSALDREFVKQAAKGAGLDPGEMLNMTFNQARINHINKQIKPGTDKNTSEYIRNIGEIDEKGRAYVALNGEKYFLDENRIEGNEKPLTSEKYEELQKESEKKGKADSATLSSIWTETSGIFEKLDNMLVYLQEKIGNWVFKIMNKVVGRDERNRDTVREWAIKNNKDVDDALRFFEVARNNSGFMTRKNRKWNGGVNDTKLANNMDEFANQIKEKEQGSSPGGFSGEIKGPSHWKGGVRGIFRGQNWEAEGGETLINKQSSARYGNVLSKIQNGTFNPYSYANNIVKNDMNKMFQPLKVSAFDRELLKNGYNPNDFKGNNVNGRIKVDIPQTITINIAGGGKIGDYDIRPIIMRYVDEIMKEMQMRKSFGSFDKENFHNQSDVLFYT